MRLKALIYMAIVAVTVLIRLYPALVTGMPFSIDAWPLLYDAETIERYTPIPLEAAVLDSYNSFWPGSIFTSLVSAIVLGVDVGGLMAILYPAINGLGTAVFIYVLGRRAAGEFAAISASAISALLYPAFFMGAGVTKEAYTFTLYLATMYIVLYAGRWADSIPLVILSLGLVLSHHLTTFMAFISLLTIGSIYLARGRLRGLVAVSSAATLFIMAYLHYIGLGHLGLRLPEFIPETLISMGAYLTIFIFLGYIHPGTRREGVRLTMNILALSIVLVALSYLVLVMGLTTGEPILEVRHFTYSIQYILLGILAYVATTKVGSSHSGIGIYSWFLGVSWIIVYSLFGGNPFFQALIYRFIDFLIPPLALLAGISGGYGGPRAKYVLAACILIVALSSLSMYVDALYLGDPYLGGSWRNRVGVANPGIFLSSHIDSGDTILYGDMVVKYIYGSYYGFDVWVSPKYLEAPASGRDGVSVIYRGMVETGLNLGPYNIIGYSDGRLRMSLNRVYDNNELWMYR